MTANITGEGLILRLLLLALFTCTAKFAKAEQTQTSDDVVANARFKFGVISVDPRLALRDFGVDTNVFNEASGAERDFTVTVSPGADLWLRTRRGLLSLQGNLDVVHFNRYSSERSINSNATGRYEYRFNRFQPYMFGRTVNTRERPGYEIDARARHYETEFGAGTQFRVFSKSYLNVQFRHLQYSFAPEVLYNGRTLNHALNRTRKSVDLGWRQRLTALTNWVVTASTERERFDFESLRNADNTRIVSGFELGRLALVRGSAFVGYRRLAPAAGGLLREFSGLTADTDVNYTAPTQTRIGVTVLRDLQFSYEDANPYYVQTSWTATLTQRLTGRWDAQVSGGRDRLSYEALSGDGHLDKIGRFGGGMGYQFGEEIRVSFDVLSYYRRSPIPGREYGGTRAGLSVKYGY
jgi:hypothetical protein